MLDANLPRCEREIDPSNESLAGVVRWRYADFASFTSTVLELLDTEHLLTKAPRYRQRSSRACANPTN